MKFIKAGLFFAVSFLLAWVVIFTFIQPPFWQTVPAKLLWYQTVPYPIYFYLLAALCAGLTIGIVMTLYYYLTFSSAARARKREIRDLTEQNATLKNEVSRLQQTCEQLREQTTRHDTQRMTAVKKAPLPQTAVIPSESSNSAAVAKHGLDS